MAERLVLGLLLFAAGIAFGWQLRAELAATRCAEAGGIWSAGLCRGAP